MRIIVDVDGVLADFAGSLTIFIQQRFGVWIDPDSILRWNMPISKDLTMEYCIRCFFADPMRALNVRAIPGAKLGMEDLKRAGHYLFIASARYSVHVDITELWLWGNQIPFDKCLHTSEKEKLDGDILIDDRASTAVRWAEDRRIAILLRRRWNEFISHAPKAGLYVCNSWPEVVSQIGEFQCGL